ncbi:hypothetical protein K1T71_012657 [Dendrolimus kikuchii]|uniref:Uncharacterized protein n=1 Tax=Dendrolimus kikuchii TaxID=765133 RepID=A0ACC1CKE2_9NEOP|nr:hypothetical protein K1T71_012657 [Dendrolimus kikuchii]
MVVLTENGLNKRHREFNRKVIEAVEKNLNFDDVKVEGNESDIHNLYKIDLASKYRNIDYILEVLKSGDSLCIARALKCIWMFEPEYSHIINPQFINDELFPHLSLKSKKKLLTTISKHVTNEQVAFDFYEFCNSLKFYHNAFKFLLYTTEDKRIELLSKNPYLLDGKAPHIKNFIGNSLNLAITYLKVVQPGRRENILHNLNYLYTVRHIGQKYLDLIETYHKIYESNSWYYKPKKFGLRMSKKIILKHKDRIYKKPRLYTQLIKESMFTKYSTVDDAKYYLTVLLPNIALDFWNQNYCKCKKHFFDLIPKEEKYDFIKKIFNEKYPKEPFELTLQFYGLRYYDLIVDLQLKEEWALRHIESGKEILGQGKDYLWYRFINFNKSFDALKEYIRINKDGDIRAQIIEVLIESARNDRELETLFKYYCEKHINEERYQKERFLDAVENHHNILNFDTDCFAVFDQIYFSLEVYNDVSTCYYKENYHIIGVVYRILNNMEMPATLTTFMSNSFSFYTLHCITSKLTPIKISKVFDYLMEFYSKSIKAFDNKSYNETVRRAVGRYIHIIIKLMGRYNKPKEEIPAIVMKYIRLDWEEFKNLFHSKSADSKPLTCNDVLRYLKRDSSEFILALPAMKERIKNSYNNFKVNHVLRKLRVYFSNDLAKEYLKFYKETLEEPDLVKYSVNILVFGIIQLESKEFLIDFLTKHLPVSPKIDHPNIDRKLLNIQSAICSYAGYTRPPIPLPLILQYIKGDYTQYCLPIFQMYLANLQPAHCKNFIKSITDVPVSIQKHGLRLVFESFPVDELKTLVTCSWKRTKNISIRAVIYKALYNIIRNDDNVAMSLFKLFNSFTSTISEEDDDELFNLMLSNYFPDDLISKHLKTVWETFEKLPYKIKFIEYRQKAIQCIEDRMVVIEPKCIIENIIDEHIRYVFDYTQDKERYKMLQNGGVLRSKWHLTASYITFLKNKENLEKKLNWVRYITSKCCDKWNEVIDDTNTYRNFFREFLTLLKIRSYKHDVSSYKHANILFEAILKGLTEALPIKETYQTIWELKLNILTRDIISHTKDNNNDKYVKTARKRIIKEIVSLILDFIEKGMFWIVFADDIVNAINYEIFNIEQYLYMSFVSYYKYNICLKLTKAKRFETLFLAAKMLEDRIIRLSSADCDKLKEKLQSCGDMQINRTVTMQWRRHIEYVSCNSSAQLPTAFNRLSSGYAGTQPCSRLKHSFIAIHAEEGHTPLDGDTNDVPTHPSLGFTK